MGEINPFLSQVAFDHDFFVPAIMMLTKTVRKSVVAPWVSELRNHGKGVSICPNHLKLLTGWHLFPNQLILLAGAGLS